MSIIIFRLLFFSLQIQSIYNGGVKFILKVDGGIHIYIYIENK